MKQLRIALLLALPALLAGCVPMAQQAAGTQAQAVVRADGTVQYVNPKAYQPLDHVYEPGIRSVLFYRDGDSPVDKLNLPLLFLHDQESALRLEFDEMGSTYHNYYFKILACNYDWSPAMLQELEYLNEFNEYIVDSYELSAGPRVPYVHYRLTLPRLKLSGNYVLKVYRNRNVDDLVITRRFMVYENAVTITPEIKFPVDPATRFSHQQVDFTIRYGTMELFNPREMVKVVLRQNARWDNAIVGLKPMFIREEDKLLDYHFFNNENVFDGNNEWRSFDIRSLRFKGFGVDRVAFDNEEATALLAPDGSRNEKNYSQWVDANGRFVIRQFESDDATSRIQADYVRTTFTLVSPRIRGQVYVFGLLSDFEPLPSLRMQYVDSLRVYRCTALLKQGIYNYQYAVQPDAGGPLNTRLLEGAYSQTENVYDIMAYFRPIGARYDRLIGYKQTDYYGREGIQR